jgi:hypothetical protein
MVSNTAHIGRDVVLILNNFIWRHHLLAYIGIAILFLLIGVLVGNLHGWHECRWFYGVGTPQSNTTPCPSCGCLGGLHNNDYNDGIDITEGTTRGNVKNIPTRNRPVMPPSGPTRNGKIVAADCIDNIVTIELDSFTGIFIGDKVVVSGRQ